MTILEGKGACFGAIKAKIKRDERAENNDKICPDETLEEEMSKGERDERKRRWRGGKSVE